MPRDNTRLLRGLRQMGREAPIRVTVAGHCLAPAAEHGAMVEVAPSRRYWPGDVIAFRAADGRLLLHRLIGMVVLRRKLFYVTHGDGMSGPDRPVAPDMVVGRLCGGECSPRLVNVPFRDRVRALGRFARLGLRRVRSA